MSADYSSLRGLAVSLSGAASCRRAVIVAALLVLASPVALAQYEDIDWIGRAMDRQQERLQGVERYVERLAGSQLPGMVGNVGDIAASCVDRCVVYQIERKPDGTLGRRILSALEVQTLAGASPGIYFLEAYGGALLEIQESFNEVTGGERMNLVLGGIANRDWELDPNGTGVDNPGINRVIRESRMPWLNPWRMFAAGGVMMLETADAFAAAEQSLATSAEQVQAESDRVNQVLAKLEPAGTEELEGGPAARFSTAANLHWQMDTVGAEPVFLESGSVWIDLDKEVIAAHRIEGTMTQDGQMRPFFLEVHNVDYRQVPGCSLYEPYRRVVRMGGLLDEKQMAQMEEAKQRLAEFDQQMAAMPQAQRAMMEGMLGGQMATLRSMASSGAIEHVQEVEEIICNPDLAALFGGGGSAPVSLAVDLAEIQRNLAALGYQPGNTDGVLDTLTEIAISQFEAEHGMAVTGKPSPQLAAALMAAVAG
jgi:hypothetical protein